MRYFTLNLWINIIDGPGLAKTRDRQVIFVKLDEK